MHGKILGGRHFFLFAVRLARVCQAQDVNSMFECWDVVLGIVDYHLSTVVLFSLFSFLLEVGNTRKNVILAGQEKRRDHLQIGISLAHRPDSSREAWELYGWVNSTMCVEAFVPPWQ